MPGVNKPNIAGVIIGRNEGEKFLACLASLPADLSPVIYVDSGSTDGSVEAAQQAGAQVVLLDDDQPFTAARARNAGLATLREGEVDFVQFIDGDCALRDGWIAAACEALQSNERLAVVCGRRRERHPEKSIYNRLCDAEWDTPVGPASACGGDAMMRLPAVKEVEGFCDDLIAGEEPDLCVRLRLAGWEIERIDAEMTWHDAGITRFRQWWQRCRRAGHAFAEGAAIHGSLPERHWVAETRRAMFWGAILPLLILMAFVASKPLGAALFLIYPAQVLRLALREGAGNRAAWERAIFMVLGKFPEVQGVHDYYVARKLGRSSSLIEYK